MMDLAGSATGLRSLIISARVGAATPGTLQSSGGGGGAEGKDTTSTTGEPLAPGPQRSSENHIRYGHIAGASASRTGGGRAVIALEK
jgi:hypothetical protein